MPNLSTWSALAHAPPSFLWQGKTVVPVEFSRYELSLNLDAVKKRGVGLASIEFSVAQRGCPLLDMVPEPRKIEVDGASIPISRFPEVVPPDNQAPVRVLDIELAAGAHRVIIEYELNSVSFDNNGVQLAFFMTDLDERGYLEHHAPANLEFNQFPMTVNIAVSGASRTPKLFTNGNAATTGNNQWRVEFPPHFSASSFFLHLSDRAFHVQDGTFNGQAGNVPLTAYGLRRNDLSRAIATAKSVLAELENTYGAYAHSRLMMYVTGDDDGGGMEYCGATMTSLDALPHEILHSWFARGVMPANGNAGWIDEGIADWRDRNYPTRRPNPGRRPTQLAGFSPYRRRTPDNAYTDGSMFLSELDHMFSRGGGTGLRPVLKALYSEKKLQQITTEFLKNFLEHKSGQDLSRMFDRFIYGQEEPELLSFEARVEQRRATEAMMREYEAGAPPKSRGFTREELNALR